MASDDMTYIEIFNREQKVEESLSTTGHIALNITSILTIIYLRGGRGTVRGIEEIT